VQGGCFRSPIADADFNQDVLGIGFGVFDEDIEITVFVENSGIEQFIFQFVPAAIAVGGDQVLIGVSRLRILIEVLHVGVRGRAIQVKVIFLHVFAVIALLLLSPNNRSFRMGSLPFQSPKAKQRS